VTTGGQNISDMAQSRKNGGREKQKRGRRQRSKGEGVAQKKKQGEARHEGVRRVLIHSGKMGIGKGDLGCRFWKKKKKWTPPRKRGVRRNGEDRGWKKSKQWREVARESLKKTVKTFQKGLVSERSNKAAYAKGNCRPFYEKSKKGGN